MTHSPPSSAAGLTALSRDQAVIAFDQRGAPEEWRNGKARLANVRGTLMGGEITGSPGVCLSTRGPGAANMVNGVAHAFLDRAPLIAITDAYSKPTYEIGLRQKINQLKHTPR